MALLTALGPRLEGRVFPVDQNALKMRYRRAVQRAGIDDLTFHDLRHIAMSRLARFHPSPLDLKRVTGHKDLKSRDRYYHATAAELAARVEPSPEQSSLEKRRGVLSARYLLELRWAPALPRRHRGGFERLGR